MGLTRISSAHGAGVGRHEMAGDDRTERMPQQDRVRAQAQGGHEVADELAVARQRCARRPANAAELPKPGQVRHDQAHVGQLVGHPEQAVVVAAEAVDDQDGAGFGGHPDGFVDPVRDLAAVRTTTCGPGAGVESAAEAGAWREGSVSTCSIAFES